MSLGKASSSMRWLARLLYSPSVLPWTNTATGIIFFGIGDVVVQRIVERKTLANMDGRRSGVSMIAGAYMGFVGHHWYRFLDHRFPGNSIASIRRKLAAELAVGPPFAASMFLLVGSLERKSLPEIWRNVKDNFLYLMLADWGFYIPLQYFNFYYLPPRFRLLYVALISIIYDSALVYLLHKDCNDDVKVKKT